MDVFDLIGGKIVRVSTSEKLMIEKDDRRFLVWPKKDSLYFTELVDKRPKEEY